MLRVQVGDQAPVDATEVVLFDGDIPLAACVIKGGAIFFCDALRDRGDLEAVLDELGVAYNKSRLPKHDPEFQAAVKSAMTPKPESKGAIWLPK